MNFLRWASETHRRSTPNTENINECGQNTREKKFLSFLVGMK
jgi:hypothetical protein